MGLGYAIALPVQSTSHRAMLLSFCLGFLLGVAVYHAAFSLYVRVQQSQVATLKDFPLAVGKDVKRQSAIDKLEELWRK